MDLTIKINKKERLAYIPKILCDILGDNPKATPNRAAVLLFAEHTSFEDALKSIEIIKSDLMHAQEMQTKRRKCDPFTSFG